MTLRLQFECYHEQNSCRCNNIKSYSTKITTQEVSSNLIRCNPMLAKYFSAKSFTGQQTNQTGINRREYQKKIDSNYVSIVQQKNLKILLSDRYPVQKNKAATQKKSSQNRINNQNVYVQTSPRGKSRQEENQIKKKGNSPNSKNNGNNKNQQIKQFYRELKQTSRYLSDTAFRKYFNKQCFQNYGHNNISHPADGIVYGNYLKTHNINPHTGNNNPMDEQTFYQALVSASPQKYKQYQNFAKSQPNKPNNLQYTNVSRKDQINERVDEPIHKHSNNVNQVISDNLSRSQLKQKYNHMRLQQSPKNTRVKNDKNIKQAAKNNVYTPHSPKHQRQKLTLNQIELQKKYQNQNKQRKISYLNTGQKKNQNIHQSSKNNSKKVIIQSNVRVSKKIQLKQNNNQICPVDYVYQHNLQHRLSKQCHRQSQVFNSPKNHQNHQNHKNTLPQSPIHNYQNSPKNNSHCQKSQCKNGTCSNCLAKMKNYLKKQGQLNNDLSNRLIGSARKQTIYKNYSLNNAENCKKNPHNYVKQSEQQEWD